ncbi:MULTISPECIES: hypothetical protein [unclassified Luteococcus]|uniref:hypothetical protein n=1 Tax=unclassified Luteococcus TaxID=2639923 RepID=UPI00313B239B
MNASLIAKASAVTPAPVRRRVREVQLRGPQARPQGLAAPGGRPAQPVAPGGHGAPVQLRLAPQRSRALSAPATRVAAADGPVRLTDRGILVIVLVLAVIAVATLALGLVKFFGVSDAPLEEQAPSTSVAVSLQS